MKSLKITGLLFAGLFLMLGASAQTTPTSQSGTSQKSTLTRPPTSCRGPAQLPPGCHKGPGNMRAPSPNALEAQIDRPDCP